MSWFWLLYRKYCEIISGKDWIIDLKRKDACTVIKIIYKVQILIFDYMNNIVNYEKAKKLASITIARCLCRTTLEIKEHSLNFNCHCCKCRVPKILLAILVERK